MTVTGAGLQRLGSSWTPGWAGTRIRLQARWWKGMMCALQFNTKTTGTAAMIQVTLFLLSLSEPCPNFPSPRLLKIPPVGQFCLSPLGQSGGHAYVEAAVSAGAATLGTTRPANYGRPYVIVNFAPAAELSRMSRQQSNQPMCHRHNGTNGKTSAACLTRY